jgi:hypothetical protein
LISAAYATMTLELMAQDLEELVVENNAEHETGY